MKRIVIVCLVLGIGLLVGCSTDQPEISVAESTDYVTPTTHPFFADREEGADNDDFPSSPATMTPAPAVNATTSQPTPSPGKEIKYVVYDELLDSNWGLDNSYGTEYRLGDETIAHHGIHSIAVTPRENYGALLFTVREDSDIQYPRDKVTGISFWLYSGDDVIETDDLLVQVQGSNSQPFWTEDDNSAGVDGQDPEFSATRLYYLDITNTIPPETWVKVEMLLENQVFDSDFEYLTGFAVFNDEMFLRTYHIDEVELIMLEDTEAKAVVATPEPSPENGIVQEARTVDVVVDVEGDVHPISPLIYGLSGGSEEIHDALRPTLLSWGGNPSTRYNWKLGNAWNAGRDWFFTNLNYDGIEDGRSASDEFAAASLEGIEVRLAVPTLGWVAKDTESCSFLLPDGTCGDADGADCGTPGDLADPQDTSVESDPDSIVEWLRHLQDWGYRVRFVAMDNEPELWGYTHYDVHPTCTTYEEVLDKFLTYATAVREAAPDVEITGPVTCCWFSYWGTAPGPADSEERTLEFIPWFLENVRQADELSGQRTLDVLDVHYYPQGVFGDHVETRLDAMRLRSTNALWDPGYVDESWIGQPIFFIPRLKREIEQRYPGTELGISEWNWGAEEHMNGALAIADVLGIYGREDVYFAAYWRNPPLDSPGFYAFKLYTNYDGQGSRFGDTSVMAQSSNIHDVGSYAALDSATGNLHLMLINKLPREEATVSISLNNFTSDSRATLYRYEEAESENIVESQISIDPDALEIILPPYSISLLVLEGDQEAGE
jgi:hypothetical protein